MCCGSGGAARAGMAYKIRKPDGTVEYRYDRQKATVIRAAAGIATIISQVPRAEADAWLAEQPDMSADDM